MARKTKSQRIEASEKQWLFFYILFQMSQKRSEISGKPIKGELNSCWFHHIYPKSLYPDLRYCAENIIIVTSDEHARIESGEVFEEVELRKKKIEQNYEQLVKDTKLYESDFLNPVYEHAKQNTTFFKKTTNHEV